MNEKDLLNLMKKRPENISEQEMDDMITTAYKVSDETMAEGEASFKQSLGDVPLTLDTITACLEGMQMAMAIYAGVKGASKDDEGYQVAFKGIVFLRLLRKKYRTQAGSVASSIK